MSDGTTSAAATASTSTTTTGNFAGAGGGGGGGSAGNPEAQGLVIDEDFLQTGRTGRRNALGDILDENKTLATSAGLTETMRSLSFGTDPSMMPGPSGMSSSSSSSGAGGSSSGASTSARQ